VRLQGVQRRSIATPRQPPRRATRRGRVRNTARASRSRTHEVRRSRPRASAPARRSDRASRIMGSVCRGC
jgi:hypothetical protein